VRDIQWKGLCGGDWSDLSQLFDHGPVADVSSMENVIDIFKVSSNCRIE
jgi:hypothetical protein